MREQKVLLVYPPNQLMPIETPRSDGSLGPLYLAGALEDAGFQTDILDASVGTSDDRFEETFFGSVLQPNGLIRIGMTTERIAEVIAAGGYTIVGINSNFTPQTRMALEVARAAKSVNPNILVVAGGVNARNLVERFLRSGHVDVICATEGERIGVRIAETWAKGEEFRNLSGVVFLGEDGRVVRNPVRAGDTHTDLDGLPMPRWEKLPFPHYDRASPGGRSVHVTKTARSASLMTSRGCPFRCAYCHISKEKEEGEASGGIGSLRLKSVDRVFREIEILKRLGVLRMFFEDDSLLARKSRVQAIFTHLAGAGLQIADINGVNLVHLQKREGGRLEVDVGYLEILKAAGFDQIIFPVESASQRVLDKYATAKLNHATLDVVELARIATRVGIACPVNMMIGFPDETEEEILSSIELGWRLVEAGAPHCTFFIPIPFPGSRLYDIAIAGGHLDPDFDPDLLNWKNVVMRNTTVSPERLLELRDWGFERANTKSHVRMRLENSIGARWQSGNPNSEVT